MTSASAGLKAGRTHRRDRWAVLSGLTGVVVVAWLYLFHRAGQMMPMPDAVAGVARIAPWTSSTYVLVFLMWAAMMIAMMVPSATPMTLMYAGVARKAESLERPVAPTFVFVAGYVAVWIAFSVAATTVQMVLVGAFVLSPMLVSTSPLLGGVLLLGAGAYQLTPLKRACLRNCRAPAHFLSQHWRSGAGGALVMGLGHGVYCLGCCWILMGLLFVGGVMNLAWVAAIAAFVLLEKTLPFGEGAGRFAGVAMILLGALVVTGSTAI